MIELVMALEVTIRVEGAAVKEVVAAPIAPPTPVIAIGDRAVPTVKSEWKPAFMVTPGSSTSVGIEPPLIAIV